MMSHFGRKIKMRHFWIDENLAFLTPIQLLTLTLKNDSENQNGFNENVGIETQVNATFRIIKTLSKS